MPEEITGYRHAYIINGVNIDMSFMASEVRTEYQLFFSKMIRKLEKANHIDEDNKVTKGYLLSSIISD